MPYGLKHVGGKWIVYNKDTGRSLGRHQSKKKATAQLVALHIHVGHSEDAQIEQSSNGDDHPTIAEGWGGADRRSGKYL